MLPRLTRARSRLYSVIITYLRFTELTKRSRKTDNSCTFQRYIRNRSLLFSIRQRTRVLLEITGEVMMKRVQSAVKNAAISRKRKARSKTVLKISYKTILMECVHVLVCINGSRLLIHWSLNYLIESFRALI